MSEPDAVSEASQPSPRGSEPNTWAYASVQNDWGKPIDAVYLWHRYDTDHYDAGNWVGLGKGEDSPSIRVGYWTGLFRTGYDYWRISFEVDGVIWTCKDDFYCFLKYDDAERQVRCRVYREGNEGKMEVRCPVSTNCTVSLTRQESNALQFMFITGDGGLWHSIRHNDGAWTTAGSVKHEAGDKGAVKAAAATKTASNVDQLLFSTSEGGLWHTIRYADGAWQDARDVKGVLGFEGTVTAVAAASVRPNEAEFLFATSDGRWWHTIRHPDGSWQAVRDVGSEIGDPGAAAAALAN
jgi:hypothetical protein